MQSSFQQLCIKQSADEPLTISGMFDTMLQDSVGLITSLAQLNLLPRPSKPLGHVGSRVRIVVIAVEAVPPKAHGHVDVPERRLRSGRVEPDDGREADFAGGAHVNI